MRRAGRRPARRSARHAALTTGAALLFSTSLATADEAAPPAGEAPVTAQVDLTRDTKPAAAEELAPTEAPPAAPYKKTLVLDATVGAIGFLGEFRKISPPGPWMHLQLGYELLKWLMVFGEGELAFTDTSNSQAPPRTRAFPMFGFGGGARFTLRFTDRFGAYAQGSVGMMKADIATNALGLLGFREAESLGVYLGGRLGVEWYQVNRHFALGLNAGIRTAQGFAKLGAGTDSPLALDGGAALRYAF
ncbi:MAG: hypothetical protein KF764_15585 [Labilithrix sp.]|nr:hypothetical protein [Labilithrix sp.]MBX3220403.1 hypothetical protein [Labilithrix sp.]